MYSKNGAKNIRLKHYDYHSGWFFVTNNAHFNKSYFLGNLYSFIRKELIDLVKKTEGVNMDYFHIMPNHVHVILIFEDSYLPLSEFWRRYKAITTLKAKRNGFQEETLWQKNYYEHVIRNETALFRIRVYIKNNPLKEDLPLLEIYQDIKHELKS